MPHAEPPLTRRTVLGWAGAASLAPVLSACGGGGSGPDYTATIAWGRDAMRQALASAGARAGTVALWSADGGMVWQEAFGTSDAAGTRPATVDTRFNIGSVSKVIAAVAALILADRGLLALDDPIVRHLPRFSMRSPEYRLITVRHLLTHSSGLPGSWLHDMFSLAPLPGYAEELEAGLANLHLKHAPGAMAVYCNDGFTLFERVVQAVSGQSFAAFVESAVLAPLGMARSGYTLAPLPSGEAATAFIGNAPPGQEFVNGYATGGLCTTAPDMMKFAALIIQGGVHEGRRLLSAAAVAELLRPQNPDLRINLTPEWRWGLGWDNVNNPALAAAGVRALQKNGGTTAFSSDFYVLPDAGLALLLSANATGFAPAPLAEGLLLRALQAQGRIAAPPPPLPDTLAPVATPATGEVPGNLGIYARSTAPIRASSPDGVQIDLHQWAADTQSWAPLALGLRLRSDGWWATDAAPRVHYQWQDTQGQRYLLSREAALSRTYRFTQPLGQRLLPRTEPLPASWAALLGSRWRIVNESSASSLTALGLPTARLSALPELSGYLMWDDAQFLIPDGDTRARMCVQVPLNAGRDLVELIRSDDAEGPSLLAAGLRYRPTA